MSKSTTDSSANSILHEDHPVSSSPSKPSEVQTLEEWSDSVCRKMEELGRDETLRREIARRLS